MVSTRCIRARHSPLARPGSPGTGASAQPVPPRVGASQTAEPWTERRKTVSKRSVTVAAVDAEAIERDALGAIASAATSAALDDTRIHYLGRKSELKQTLHG